MATYAEIALKVTANVRDAVRGIETVDKALERTDKRLRAISTGTRQRLQGAGRVVGGLAQGRSISDIGQDFLPATGPAALALEIINIVGRKLDEYFDKRIAAADRKLAEATSIPEAVEGLTEGVSARRGGIIKDVFRTGALQGVRRAFDVFTGHRGDTNQMTRDRFRELARSEPALATAVISSLPVDQQQALWDILIEEQRRTAQREAFRAGLRPQANVVQQTTNFYSSFSGLGGEATVGREVRAVLDRRDRNNGRYVTTFNRRG